MIICNRSNKCTIQFKELIGIPVYNSVYNSVYNNSMVVSYVTGYINLQNNKVKLDSVYEYTVVGALAKLKGNIAKVTGVTGDLPFEIKPVTTSDLITFKSEYSKDYVIHVYVSQEIIDKGYVYNTSTVKDLYVFFAKEFEIHSNIYCSCKYCTSDSYTKYIKDCKLISHELPSHLRTTFDTIRRRFELADFIKGMELFTEQNDAQLARSEDLGDDKIATSNLSQELNKVFIKDNYGLKKADDLVEHDYKSKFHKELEKKVLERSTRRM